ncbi:MAG: Tim44-like domain-containing protein [Mariprofundaceae bacterium]|nr:Tim44-like domain-containing protein [Mariprofundaceae bacterium]
MKKCLIFAMLAIFPLVMLLPDDADARRFGGGSSFGKQRMHQSTPKAFAQKKTAPRNSASNNQRGSTRTGMMGMLGGLALGGMLGAMFFGGAFEGVNFFDILVIGGLIFLVLWFLRRKTQPGGVAYAGQQHPSESDASASDAQASQVTMLRPNINEKHFLKAARDIFMRMQTAWDARDMDDIRRFCTPEIAEKIAADMQQSDKNNTEVATLHAEIDDSWIESDLEWAAIHFTAMLREQSQDADGQVQEDASGETHETWIFRHDPNADDPIWYLAGIQQNH